MGLGMGKRDSPWLTISCDKKLAMRCCQALAFRLFPMNGRPTACAKPALGVLNLDPRHR